MKKFKLFSIVALLFITITSCKNEGDAESSPAIPVVPYPAAADSNGAINKSGLQLFLGQHLLSNLKTVLLNLASQYAPMENIGGKPAISVKLPGVSLDASSDMPISFALRDGCLGDSTSDNGLTDSSSDASSDAASDSLIAYGLSAEECATDDNPDTIPTHTSRISINLEDLEKSLSIRFVEPDEGQGLALEVTIDKLPISADIAAFLDLGDMLGLSGACLIGNRVNTDGSTDAAITINHVGVKVALASREVVDGHSLYIALERRDISLIGPDVDSFLK